MSRPCPNSCSGGTSLAYLAVLAAKYGQYANDQWSGDELLVLARREQQTMERADARPAGESRST
jgi:hypothetical protein